MKAHKYFDSVAMKNEIQRKLIAKHRGMSAAAVRADIHRKLETSRSPVGQLWRRLRARSTPARQLTMVAR
jgi:hypothetical protein